MTVTIRENDIIESVADALQYISYFHPMDYIRALGDAYEKEQGPAAKDAIAQILTNSRMCAEGHRPICQQKTRFRKTQATVPLRVDPVKPPLV